MITPFLVLLATAPELPPPADPAKVIVLHAAGLNASRDQLAAGDGPQEAFDALVKSADEALKAGPYSVMDKELTPPSGDKHDYMSVGPYWWPNPDTPDGLPYIRKDGEVNPERRDNQTDATSEGRMTSASTALAMGYFFTGKAEYAQRAALLLRTWFLDPATKMNPNLNYGQAIPGRTEGRGIGIIDTGSWVALCDAIGLLAGSDAWTAADQAGMEQWFGDYLDWLLTSKHGQDEGKTGNNHGTYYDLQVARYAIFAGRPEVAKRVLDAVPTRRIAKHVEPDGQQPQELARTKAFGYSRMNLMGFMNLATVADTQGLDLWGFKTADGRGIQAAVDYLVQYADPAKEWPHKELSHGPRPADLSELLVRAKAAYDDPKYAELLADIPAESYASTRWRLSWPD